MTLRGDERAASVQIGAVILFGFIVVTMATWQATVVPQENARVEYTHNERAQDDMQSLRNSIVSAAGGGNAPSVGIDMAPEYPARAIFVNPPRPSARIRTVGTENASLNLTVTNATAVDDDDAADFWNGTARTYRTGGIVYDPDYHEYRDAPDTVYDNTVLYNVHPNGANVTLAGQNLVDGTDINLVTLNGSLDRSTGSTYTIDPKRLSSSTRTVTITNTTGNVTVSFASRRDATFWTDRLDGELLANGGNVVDVRSTPLGGGFHNLTIELAGGETYELRMTSVGVGSGTESPSVGYLTDVDGNGSSIAEGGTQQVVVEVRDRYNNPVSGVTVEASVDDGSLKQTQVTTNSEGRAVFDYEARTDVDSEQTVLLNATITSGVSPGSSSFDPGAVNNTQVTLFVQDSDGSGSGGGGGGGSAYTIDWDPPDTLSGNPGTGVSCSDTENCTWNVGDSGTTKLDMRAVTSKQSANLSVDFGVNDSSVAYPDPSDTETNDDGQATTELLAQANGTVEVVAVSGGDLTTINITIENFTVGNQPPTADFSYSPTTPKTNETVTFDAAPSSDPENNISSYEWDLDGDGNFDDATGQTTTTSWGANGNKDVSLRVTDNESNTDTVTKTVSVVNRAPSATFNKTCTNLECEFDASNASDPDGTISTYKWDWDGDGTYENTTSSAVINHTFASDGTYTVTLEVVDNDTATDTFSKQVTVNSNSPPTANIFANKTTAATNETIGFDGLNSTDSDGTITSYEWDFGDGSANVTGSTVSHAYTDNGTYEVVLTVTDDNGATDVTSTTVTVTNRPPSANFTYSPSRPISGESASFDASNSTDADGSITSYEWDWDGDGTYEQTTTSATTSHTFATTGSYNVTLRVTDDDGTTTVTNETVQVIGGRIDVAYVTGTPNGNRLRAIDNQGRRTYFDVGGNVERVGPASTDLDDDGLLEVTYITSSGYIKYTDRKNQTSTLLNAVSAGKGGIAVGTWNASNTSVFFVNNNDQTAVYRKEPGGTRQKVLDYGTDLKAVLGFGDIDRDGAKEMVVLNSDGKMMVGEQDGTTNLTDVSPASSSGPAIGSVADYNGDGFERAAIVDGSNKPTLVACDWSRRNKPCKNAGNTETLNPSDNAKKAPFAAANWTGDSTPELVYAENANSPAELYYVEVTASDNVGTEAYVNDTTGSRITIVISKGIGNARFGHRAIEAPD